MNYSTSFRGAMRILKLLDLLLDVVPTLLEKAELNNIEHSQIFLTNFFNIKLMYKISKS